MESTVADPSDIAKGLQSIALTRTDSDASTGITGFSLNPPPVLRAATEISNIDVETFYERVMRARSFHCRHTQHETCVMNVCASFASQFKYGFIASYVLGAIPHLSKGRLSKLVKMFLSKKKAVDSCKLALFIGLLCSLYKAVLCLVRRAYPHSQSKRANQVAAPIAGFVCGLSLLTENRQRKKYLKAFALSRFVDTALNLMLNKTE